MRSLYLWFKGWGLKSPLQIAQAFSRIKAVFVHLPRAPGHTIFALPVVEAVKTHFSKARVWTISRNEERPLLERVGVGEHLFYHNYPRPFTKEYKELAHRVPVVADALFLDFNLPGSRELALLTRAKIRWSFFAPKLFPFFNLMVKLDDGPDYAGLITPILGPVAIRPIRLTAFAEERRAVRAWLSSRGSPLVVVDRSKGREGVLRQIEQEGRFWIVPADSAGDRLIGLLDAAAAFIGGLGLPMELALALGKPVVLLEPARVPAWEGLFLLPQTARLSEFLAQILR